MGDQTGDLQERGRATDAPSTSTLHAPADPSHHHPASVGERAAPEFKPAAFPHQPNQLNQAGYHMQPQYSQPDPYAMAGMRQALPDYSSPAPYGYQPFPNQHPGPPAVYPGQYPQNASYGPPAAYGSPYPPQYGQRSPVDGHYDQNAMAYQYYPDVYGRPSGSPTIYMQQVPQFHQPAMLAGPQSSASWQPYGGRGPSIDDGSGERKLKFPEC